MARDQDVMTIAEAAAYLGVHIQTLRRLTRLKKVPGFKVGREWRFREEALIRWADEQGQGDLGQDVADNSDPSCSVVIVDDEEDVCKALSGALRRIGCDPRHATSGARGIELIADDVPDLVLLDLHMPDMTGPMFLSKLRRTHPNLPVAIVTGYPDSNLMHEATKHAPIIVLGKPVEQDILERTVRLVLGKKERIR